MAKRASLALSNPNSMSDAQDAVMVAVSCRPSGTLASWQPAQHQFGCRIRQLNVVAMVIPAITTCNGNLGNANFMAETEAPSRPDFSFNVGSGNIGNSTWAETLASDRPA